MSEHRLPVTFLEAGSPLSSVPAPLSRERVSTGYIDMPKLDRLMELRDALVVLQGPLANDPDLRENVQNLLFNEEASDRVLGKVCALRYPIEAL